MWGRSLLREGLQWRVGDGRSIKIVGDNWIPRASMLKVLQKEGTDPDARVSELLSPNGSWNVSVVQAMFKEDDVQIILGISCPRLGCSDRLVWHYEKEGIYLVKSGYNLTCNSINARVLAPQTSRKYRGGGSSFGKEKFLARLKVFPEDYIRISCLLRQT